VSEISFQVVREFDVHTSFKGSRPGEPHHRGAKYPSFRESLVLVFICLDIDPD